MTIGWKKKKIGDYREEMNGVGDYHEWARLVTIRGEMNKVRDYREGEEQGSWLKGGRRTRLVSIGREDNKVGDYVEGGVVDCS